MKRITSDEIVNAYKQTSLKPMQRGFFKDGCACAFAALYVANGGDQDSRKANKFADEFTGSYEYSSGFMMGFDGDALYNDANEEYAAGYFDGKIAWDAVKDF